MINLTRFSSYATVPLRWGIGFVFLYFGLQKYISPQAAGFTDFGLPLSIAPMANFIFGALELFVAISMLLGIFVRPAAAVASALLILILVSFPLKYGRIGFDTIFRDIAILGGAISLLFRCDDRFCIVKPKE